VLAYEAAVFDPAPIPYDDLPLDPRLLSGIKDLGWSDTRPVQSGVIPLAIQGGDVIACAETGTGKTAAFLVPILQRFLNEPAPQPPRTRALVLAPTRELAVQIEDQVQGLTYHTTISSVAVYGGVPMDTQERALKANVDIVVATPGRLMDHMRHDSINFSGLEILVLDEADRMLDMGFLPAIKRISKAIPANRQTLFFSATLSNEIERIALSLMDDPHYVEVSVRGKAAVTIDQKAYPVAQQHKMPLLLELLEKEDFERVLVFTRTKRGADRIAHVLEKRDHKSNRIHGNRSQSQREAALRSFKSGHTRVLVATDVAARGIDISSVSHVINYDIPVVPEDYVHRIGRTGRAGNTGRAITLFTTAEESSMRAIEKLTGQAVERVHLPNFGGAVTTVASTVNNGRPAPRVFRSYGGRRRR